MSETHHTGRHAGDRHDQTGLERSGATTPEDFREKANVAAVFPLTALQQGLLAHHLLRREADPYRVQRLFEIDGETVTHLGRDEAEERMRQLDLDCLEAAWQACVARHPILRCDIRWEGLPQPLHVCYRRVPVCMRRLDWRGRSPADQVSALRQDWAQTRADAAPLEKSASLDVQVIQVGERRHWLVWRFHHMQLDGWSKALVLADVMTAYDRIGAGLPVDPAPAPSFQAYVRWLGETVRAGVPVGGAAASAAAAAVSPRDDEDAVWWRRYLQGIQAPTALTQDGSGTSGQAVETHRYAERCVALPTDESISLDTIAAREGVTPSVLVQAAWALVLAEDASSGDVLFGVTLSGRPADLDGSDMMAGLFIQTLPYRVRLDASTSLTVWLQDLHRLSHALQQRRPPSPACVPATLMRYESSIVFENYPVEDALLSVRHDGLRMRPLLDGDLDRYAAPVQDGAAMSAVRQGDDVRVADSDSGLSDASGRTHYPLNLVVAPGTQYHFYFAYDRRRCSDAHVETLAAAFIQQLCALLRGLSEAPMTPLSVCVSPALAQVLMVDVATASERMSVNAGATVGTDVLAPTSAPQAAPANLQQSRLLDIWRTVLGDGAVGVDDDFFACGGDSVLSLHVVNHARRAGIHLDIRDVFEAPTVARLDARLTQVERRTALDEPTSADDNRLVGDGGQARPRSVDRAKAQSLMKGWMATLDD